MNVKKLIVIALCGAVFFTGALSLTSCFKGIENSDDFIDDPIDDDQIDDNPIDNDDNNNSDGDNNSDDNNNSDGDNNSDGENNTDGDNNSDGETDGDDGEEPSPHMHSAVKVEAVAPTCESEGNIEYWCCFECGKYFFDEECTAEASANQLILEKTAHNYENGYCTVCGESDPNYVAPTYSEGLAYTLSDDGAYYTVSGIGTCADTEIVIPDTYENIPVKEIGGYAFCAFDLESFEELGSDIVSVVIPEGITTVGEGAFYGCTSLEKIIISDSVTVIGDYAFSNCESLTEIDIPDGVASIGYSAFYSCYSLENVIIGDGVTEIGIGAFYMCDALAGITLPDGVASIGASAFRGCRALVYINIGSGLTEIGDYAFGGCVSLSDITIPAATVNIGQSAFVGCKSLKSITVDGENQNYKSIDGNLYSKDGTKLIQYAVGNTSTEFAIPFGVTTVCENALYDGLYLIEVTIPDSVTVIGDYAFNWCSALEKIIIPDSVVSIGENAFENCSSLTQVAIGGGVTEIGAYAFHNCVLLGSVEFKITDGWTVGDTSLSADVLSDSLSAAACFTVNYYWLAWERTE